MVKKIFITIIGLLTISCSDNLIMESNTNEMFLDLHMNTLFDNGYYLVDYPNHEDNSYTSVQYKTLPDTRVFWTSVDSFTVYHWNQPITQPIINYSTYSNSDSTGQQMIYLNKDFIGDTLMIFGWVDENTISTLNFIVY